MNKNGIYAAVCVCMTLSGCAAPGTGSGDSDFVSSVRQAFDKAASAAGLTGTADTSGQTHESNPPQTRTDETAAATPRTPEPPSAPAPAVSTASSGGDFFSSLKQAIGTASIAVGLTSVATAISTKNPSLISSGGNLLQQGAELLDKANKPSAPVPSGGGVPVASSGSGASSAAGGPAGADCLSYLRRRQLEALTNARQCQVNESAMELAKEGAPASSSPLAGSCGGDYNYIDQRIAQQACGRVYWCAAMAYSEALKEAKAGASCPAAMQTGIARYPIPRVN